MGGKEYLGGLRDYILKLLGQDIHIVSSIKLSSAQKARVADWHIQNNYNIPDLTNTSFWNTESIDSKDEIKNSIDSMHNSLKDLDDNLSVGIDIQLISEFLPDELEISKSSKELSSIFTKHELSYCEGKDSPKESAAGIFALKEAILKAGKINYNSLKEIEIIVEEGKTPKHDKFILSLSHSGDMVCAIAIQLLVGEYKKPSEVNTNNSLLLWRVLVTFGSLGGLIYVISNII